MEAMTPSAALIRRTLVGQIPAERFDCSGEDHQRRSGTQTDVVQCPQSCFEHFQFASPETAQGASEDKLNLLQFRLVI